MIKRIEIVCSKTFVLSKDDLQRTWHVVIFYLEGLDVRLQLSKFFITTIPGMAALWVKGDRNLFWMRIKEKLRPIITEINIFRSLRLRIILDI